VADKLRRPNLDWEARVRRNHPLRAVREIANVALVDLSGDFEALYPARLGRRSIPPERLLRAMLLQALYGIGSERQLAGEIAAKFPRAVLAQPKVKRLLSSDHFSVDGTLIEAWASIKSFRRKDGNDNDADGPGRNAEGAALR
jgi:hypothetical protein